MCFQRNRFSVEYLKHFKKRVAKLNVYRTICYLIAPKSSIRNGPTAQKTNQKQEMYHGNLTSCTYDKRLFFLQTRKYSYSEGVSPTTISS